MTFGEDYSRIRRDHSGENFALMRRTALSLLKHTTDKKARSIKGRRAKAGWDNSFLTTVLVNGLRKEAIELRFPPRQLEERCPQVIRQV